MLSNRLQFQRAIRLLPLNDTQIEAYFDSVGESLASLKVALNQDEVLQELAQSPLMLSIMTLAYRDIPVEALISEELSVKETRRSHLFDTYISRMMTRRGVNEHYSPEQTVSWLSWLAPKYVKT